MERRRRSFVLDWHAQMKMFNLECIFPITDFAGQIYVSTEINDCFSFLYDRGLRLNLTLFAYFGSAMTICLGMMFVIPTLLCFGPSWFLNFLTKKTEVWSLEVWKKKNRSFSSSLLNVMCISDLSNNLIDVGMCTCMWVCFA